MTAVAGAASATGVRPDSTVLVVGGGIAGPTLAMFLQRVGVAPLVLEGRPAPAADAGAFLNLAPSGMAVLDELGLGDRVRAAGTPTTAIRFHDHRGAPVGELAESTLLIRRSALNRLLREAARARGARLRYGARVVEAAPGAGQDVAVRLEDGTVLRGALLVGCDGIRSSVRRSLLPDAPEPAYTGVVDTGGFTQNRFGVPADGVMRMTFGVEGFFGYQAVPSGETFWFANLPCPSAGELQALLALDPDEWRNRVLETHRRDHAPVAEIIRATPGPLPRWPIHDLAALPAWHRGRICLVGDAAHATSPHTGQGASLALEDALVLARCLRDLPTAEQAFAAFERERRRRVERVVREARRTGSRKAPSGAVARRLRDLVLPFFLRVGARKLRESYRFRVEWERPAG